MATKRKPGKRTYFKLLAPEAEQVMLCGCFTQWEDEARPLKQNAKGEWRTSVTLAPGTYEYRFVVDGQWRNDPAADQVPNPYGDCNCVATVT